MNPLPGRLVLLGHPVSHSLSPAFQNAALRAAGIPLEYEPLDVVPGELARVAGLLREANAAGNVTVPHKEAFAAACGSLTPVAARVGAVNTFWTADGALVGDNTDVGGFEAAVRDTVGTPGPGSKVAVLGAGGSAAAVLATVERWEGVRAAVWSRTASRAERLASRFARVATAVWDDADALADAALVVNATPVGLHGDAMPVDAARIEAKAAIFDLVYRRGETPWVHACRARGLRASDGLPMLLEQGALAFERWFGVVPDRAVMHEAVQ